MEKLVNIESATLGATVLAGCGVEVFENIRVAAKSAVQVDKRYDLQSDRRERYDRSDKVYCGACSELVDNVVFKGISAIQ